MLVVLTFGRNFSNAGWKVDKVCFLGKYKTHIYNERVVKDQGSYLLRVFRVRDKLCQLTRSYRIWLICISPYRHWWSMAFVWHLVHKNKKCQVEWTHLGVSYRVKMLMNFGYSHRFRVGPWTSLNSFIQQQFYLRKEVLWLHFTLDTLCPFVHQKAQKTNCSWGSRKLTGSYLLSKIPFNSFFSLHIRKVAPKQGIWSGGGKCGFHM